MVKLMHFDDPKNTDADREIYSLVAEVAREYGADPTVPIESEEFFRNLLANYDGPIEGLQEWLAEQLPKYFIAIGERPRWLQGAEWPFDNGSPMVFVGQIDILAESENFPAELFHDTTSFYVFIGRKYPPVVVIQQM